MKIGIVVASVRDNRKGIHIARWVKDQSQSFEGVFDLIDLKTLHLPHFNEPSSPRTAKEYKYTTTKVWSQKVSAYEGFIFVTPEYNGFFPGSLKDAIDLLYHEWEGKPYGIVGYGGRGAKWASDHLNTLLERFSMKNLGFVGILKPEKAFADNKNMDPTYIEGNLEKLFKAFIK
jgi:NAD(P)H-dependent FMN reductase